MRTRFLNHDYFALPPSQHFLHLSIPHLPPPPPTAVHDFLRFHSPLPLSHHIDPLPIEPALSTFLSAILPHKIRFQLRDLTDADVCSSNRSDRSSSFFDGNEIIQFEAPELYVLLENVCFAEKERIQVLSQTPEVENSLEMLKSEPLMQYPYEALESISFIEDTISEYLKKEDAYSFEDNISVQHLPHSGQNIFFTLEVNEGSFGIPRCLSMVEVVSSYFDSIKFHNFDEENRSIPDCKELLGSMNHNMMQSFSDDSISKEILVLPNMFPERDFIKMLETEHVEGNTALQISQDDNALLNLVTYEEFVFLDDDLVPSLEAFPDKKALDILETSDWMFKKEFNFKNFDELIVSNEIALTDDTFKSLPVPVISDNKKIITLHDIIGELFSNLKTRPLSASDGIYLNWDLLEEDKCNCNISNCYQNLWAKIDLNYSDVVGKSLDDGEVVFDLVFSGDTTDECDIKQSEDLQKLLSDCMLLPDNHFKEFASSKRLKLGSSKQASGEPLSAKSAERASLFLKSKSEISNLEYFLNPQKATDRENFNSVVESTNAHVTVPKARSTEHKAGQESQGRHTILHSVKLSDNIVALTQYFEKYYLAILQSDTELLKLHNSDVDYFKLLSLQKHKLMQCYVNGNNMAFIVLSAIKQAAWYLCFYGHHPACLYLNKLCQNLDYLKSRLGSLQSLIEDENRKVGNNITMAHPTLTVIKETLQSNMKWDGLKVLIVAEEVFWWSLKNLLLSLGLSFTELSNSYRNQPNANNVSDSKMKELMVSDCLLASYKHVSPLFPFNKFDTIFEYGGPYGSSRISEFSPNSEGLPPLHLLTVELDGHPALKALCEGVENTEKLMGSEARPIFNPDESMMNQKLERLLNFCPVQQSCDIKSSNIATEAENFVPLIPAVKSERCHQGTEPFPGSVIIVNTQNVDKEMIFSRRSSYQVILAMEKGGIQVVERDLNLPVDIILSSAICLAWYDSKNLGKKATPVTEASSSLPLCIENIATDVLTLLSIYFHGCVLVFEGELDFLSTVMESSDILYGAAVSLGMDLQIFFSYSLELTNEVLVNCIKSATKLTRGLYPKMPDSVTLAESFLTEFPGINSLTAHSILSSGTMLNEFLEWSHEQRMNVLEKYHVPEESISLLSVFCRYGEREDSKSIMTDCSSSVSSGPDSDRCHLYQLDNKRKRNNVSNHQKDELCFDELLKFDTLNQIVDAVPYSSAFPKPLHLDTSKDTVKSAGLAEASLSMGGFSGQKQKFSLNMMRNPSRVPQSPRDLWNGKAPHMPEQLEQPCLSLKNKELAQNDMMDTAMIGNGLNWFSFSNSEKMLEDLKGELDDLTDFPLSDKCFSDSMHFPSAMNVAQKDRIRNNKTARRLSFDNSCHAKANSSKIQRSSLEDIRGEVDDYPKPNFGKLVFPPDFRHRENIFDEGFTQASMRNLQGSPFKEEMSHLMGTPLSRACRSACPSTDTPWTTKFINRIKEKSTLRQRSLSCGKSAPFFAYSGNMSNISNRRSPSMIESFKYQSSRTRSLPKQKMQTQSGQSSNPVKKGRYSASLSWTPDDKISVKGLCKEERKK